MAHGTASLGLTLVLHVFAAGSASAHGKPPEVTQIAVRRGEALVATTRGLLFGDPAAHRWSLLCTEAFGVRAGGSYRMAQLPSGRLIVANFDGMRVSDDRGCTWRPHLTFGDRDVTHLLQEAARPERLYVTVFGGEHGGIHASDDGGDTFRPLYRAGGDEFVNSVEVARGSPTRLYATLLTTEEIPQQLVLRSMDAGASWSRTALRGVDEMLDVTLLAINPADATELLLRVRYIDSRNGDGLLHSLDGGQSFTLLGRFGPIADATFTDDGVTSFLVASGKLLKAGTPERRYAPIGAVDGMTYGALFDRQWLLSGYRVIDEQLTVMVWASDVASPGALQRWMGFDEVTSPRACPEPSAVNARCAADWVDWSSEFLPDPAAAMPKAPPLP